MSRYLNARLAVNKNEMYRDVFDERGVKKITQYRTQLFKDVDQDVLDAMEADLYIWKYGDSFWKLASKYYGDSKLWWVIASFNRKPSETLLKLGDEIRIPLNLSEAMQVV